MKNPLAGISEEVTGKVVLSVSVEGDEFGEHMLVSFTDGTALQIHSGMDSADRPTALFKAKE